MDGLEEQCTEVVRKVSAEVLHDWYPTELPAAICWDDRLLDTRSKAEIAPDPVEESSHQLQRCRYEYDVDDVTKRRGRVICKPHALQAMP